MNTLLKTFYTILFLLIGFLINAQDDNDSNTIYVKQKADQLRKDLNTRAYGNEFEKLTSIDFMVDTFKVEELLRMKLDSDFSTNGMSLAMYDAEEEYDALLNKYYKVLMSKLNEEDKEVLKQAQRSWIAFRDNERKLHSTVCMPQYSGGGTMYNLYVADAYFQITKKRVMELYDLISLFYEYSY